MKPSGPDPFFVGTCHLLFNFIFGHMEILTFSEFKSSFSFMTSVVSVLQEGLYQPTTVTFFPLCFLLWGFFNASVLGLDGER